MSTVSPPLAVSAPVPEIETRNDPLAFSATPSTGVNLTGIVIEIAVDESTSGNVQVPMLPAMAQSDVGSGNDGVATPASLVKS